MPPSRHQRLADARRMTRKHGAQVNKELLQGLITALVYPPTGLMLAGVLAGVLAGDLHLQLAVESLQHSIRQLCAGTAKELGRDVPPSCS